MPTVCHFFQPSGNFLNKKNSAEKNNAKEFSSIARFGEPMIKRNPAMEGPSIKPQELMKFLIALNRCRSVFGINFVIYTIEVGSKIEFPIFMINTMK